MMRRRSREFREEVQVPYAHMVHGIKARLNPAAHKIKMQGRYQLRNGGMQIRVTEATRGVTTCFFEALKKKVKVASTMQKKECQLTIRNLLQEFTVADWQDQQMEPTRQRAVALAP